LADDQAVSFDEAFSVPSSWVTDEVKPRADKMPSFKANKESEKVEQTEVSEEEPESSDG